MTLQGEQCSEFFRVFLELLARGSAEDEQARDLPCFASRWVPQQHPHTRDK